MRDDVAAAIRLADYKPCDYAIDTIALRFDLEPTATRVRATSTVRRTAGEARPLVLDGALLSLERISIDGAPLPTDGYTIEPERLVIHAPPAAFTLEIDTLINPAANTALEGLYVSGGRFCTQCEAEGFRKITYALDRPDAMARYTVRIEADKARYPTLLSNGDPVESGDLAGGRHFAVWRDPHPKPAYLFALVAGAFDSIHDAFTTMSGKKVDLGVYVDDGEAPRARYAMDALKRSMAWDEKVFQREYDLAVFNIVAVRDFNFGAMENKGLNIFNAAYVLADAATATDADFEAIEGVVAHEYFHNWTGNRITLRDWFQLCLKEGLTVYRDQEFSADERSRAVKRIKDVKTLRGRQFPEDGGPLAHPARPDRYVKIDNFYTATVYEKGAEIIRVLKALIGDEAFDQGIQLYFTRCDGTAATLEDFVACFAEASGKDLSHFMHWYNQAGTPHLVARGAYDAPSRTYTLTLTQSTPPTPGQPDKMALPIPLTVGFVSKSGAELAARIAGDDAAIREHAIVLDKPSATFVFDGMVEAPTPALLRGFCAPVMLDDGLTAEDRLIQMSHDPDAFTRWEAGQRLLRDAIFAEADGKPGPSLDLLASALGRELDRAQQDAAFAALALRAPDLADLIQNAERPDPDRLFAARGVVRAAIAAKLEPRLAALADADSETPFSPDASQAGRRALKSAALDLLAALGGTHEDRVERAFARAGTMTERMAALDALGQIDGEAFNGALGSFIDMWRDNPLVVDKWFAVQAAAPRADAIDRVRALKGHELFSLRNPNRARSLIAVFAMRNLRAFHAADGSGYAFLADGVAEADALNPALASRLLTAFESWRRFDAQRQEKARAALERLAAIPTLSRNAREMVARTLE
ncbi:MAG: aminopeptidase N [Caulobacteraceae bacterium]|nr:MAG: aminopeptidase N [Caulobacteraceae bacterium]